MIGTKYLFFSMLTSSPTSIAVFVRDFVYYKPAIFTVF